MIAIGVQRLPNGEGLPLPARQTADAAGMDLMAALPPDTPLLLAPGGWALVPTGLVLEIPGGFEGQVRPRSGLALKHGITVLNAPGTIDADFRGEISVLLINHGEATFEILRGMRIAQLVIAPVTAAVMNEVDVVSATARGAGGYGSTGKGGEAVR